MDNHMRTIPSQIMTQLMNSETIKDRTWSHQIQPKTPNTIRLILQNIGRIDLLETGSIKLAAIQSYTQVAQVDICTITECNVDWTKAPAHLYLAEQTRYWQEKSHWKVTNNTQETNNALYQPGGTGLVILNQLAHRAQRPGDGKVGLGCWCWAKLCGKNNKMLKIILLYRPCKLEGPLTTYQQQLWFGYKKKQTSQSAQETKFYKT